MYEIRRRARRDVLTRNLANDGPSGNDKGTLRANPGVAVGDLGRRLCDPQTVYGWQ